MGRTAAAGGFPIAFATAVRKALMSYGATRVSRTFGEVAASATTRSDVDTTTRGMARVLGFKRSRSMRLQSVLSLGRTPTTMTDGALCSATGMGSTEGGATST